MCVCVCALAGVASRGEDAVRAAAVATEFSLCRDRLCVRVWTHGRYLIKED
jgi:hypothetical protein